MAAHPAARACASSPTAGPYLPTDGKPITLADYKLALAKGMVNKTMFAAATPSAKAKWQPAPDTDVFAEAESDAETETDTPRPILASCSPRL